MEKFCCHCAGSYCQHRTTPPLKLRGHRVEKEGGGKPHEGHPSPRRGFGPPFVWSIFHPPQLPLPCVFLVKNPRESRPEALWEGSRNFRAGAFSGTFSSPHTFCHPPISWPNQNISRLFSDRESTHHPHKIEDQHHKCKTGGGAYLPSFLGSDNSHTHFPKLPLDEEGLLWGWWMVGGPLYFKLKR